MVDIYKSGTNQNEIMIRDKKRIKETLGVTCEQALTL